MELIWDMDLRVLLLNELIIVSLVVPSSYGHSVVSAHFDSPSSIDLMKHVAANASRSAMTPIPGSNGHSTAYSLQGTNRHVEVAHRMAHEVERLLQTQEEFTLVAAVKQQEKNSGSIISITSHDTRILELESSGRRDELRLHFSHRGRLRTEIFPYKLADNQWHTIALGFSRSYVEVFIDCKKQYERRIESFDREWSRRRFTIWIGQRDATHAHFKGAIEHIRFVGKPNGILDVCPHANIACPTCSQFWQIQHSIESLYERIEELSKKLTNAEKRIGDLEQCECQHSCTANGTVYRNGETWQLDSCTNCTCKDGVIQFISEPCKPVNCSKPVVLPGACCPTCGKYCVVEKKRYDDGETIRTSMETPQICMKCTCKNGSGTCEEINCSRPPCPTEEQFEEPGECCRKCRNTKRCSLGHDCHPNATCHDVTTTYRCDCNSGFTGDGKHCTDIDECRTVGDKQGHYCHSNTRCVNTIGSYRCECEPGFIHQMGTSLFCQDYNECASNAHNCHHNAVCVNLEGSYKCQCRQNYTGDGHTCKPVCTETCQNGGICSAPEECRCRKGFYGRFCEHDVDECHWRLDDCHHRRSECVNIPGGYLCQCKPGFYSDSADNKFGSLCRDIDECRGWGGGHTCPIGTQCRNIPGSYECVCSEPGRCQGCADDMRRWHRNGESWRSPTENCISYTCQDGQISTRHVHCNCEAENIDYNCCRNCTRPGQCRHHNQVYSNGHRWVHQCQHCQCLDGEVDCWPMICPLPKCKSPVFREGDCCPSCPEEQDPCQTEGHSLVLTELNRTCSFSRGRNPLRTDPCTTCECKGGHICCRYEQNCGGRRKKLRFLHLRQGRPRNGRQGRERGRRRQRSGRRRRKRPDRE